MKKQIGFLAVCAAVNGFGQSCNPPPAHDHDHGHAESRAEVAVEWKTAEGGWIERRALFPAEIKLNRDRLATVSPRYAGTVLEMKVNPGDEVAAGDVLAVLQNRETLTAYSLTAPLAGHVLSKNGSAGESADESAVLYEVADLSSVWVEIHLFPQYQRAVQKGTPVVLVAEDGATASTVVDYVSPLVSPRTRTLTARCVLASPGGNFPPGAFVRAQIAVESVQAAVCVEKEAVQRIGGETVVFIRDADGIEPRDVDPGLSGETMVEIKSGLAAGESYVACGAFELKAELITSGIDPHAGCGH